MDGTKEQKGITGPGVSDPQGPAGEGGTVPAPCPSSSNDGLPSVSRAGAGGKRATAPAFLKGVSESLTSLEKKLVEVQEDLRIWSEYLKDPLDDEECRDRPSVRERAKIWYGELLGLFGRTEMSLGEVVDGSYGLRCDLHTEVLRLSSECVGGVDVGVGPGPGISPPPSRRSVRSGTDPGPVIYLEGRGSSPIRLGVDASTSPLLFEAGEIGTQTEGVVSVDASAGPEPIRVRGRGTQTCSRLEELYSSSSAKEGVARPALVGVAGSPTYAEVAGSGGSASVPGVILRLPGSGPVRLSWGGVGDLTIEVPGTEAPSPLFSGSGRSSGGAEGSYPSPDSGGRGSSGGRWRRAGRPSAVLPKGGPPRCYKCLEVGHTAARCEEAADRSGCCYGCGARSHKLRRCRASPACPLCRDAGRPADHVLGGRGCKSPPPPVQRRKEGVGGAPLSPGAGAGLPPTKRRKERKGSGADTPGSVGGSGCSTEDPDEAVASSGTSSWREVGGRRGRRPPRLKGGPSASSGKGGVTGGGSGSAKAGDSSSGVPSEG